MENKNKTTPLSTNYRRPRDQTEDGIDRYEFSLRGELFGYRKFMTELETVSDAITEASNCTDFLQTIFIQACVSEAKR
jgi:hypothetical protein